MNPKGKNGKSDKWGCYHKVQVQKYSSDALFILKMDIFKQTILHTAYIKALENLSIS